MILMVFCVHDRATAQYGTPMFMVSKGQCIRSFTDEVNRQDKDNQLYLHSDDFALFYLGTFDSDSAKFDSILPEQLVLAKDVKVKVN